MNNKINLDPYAMIAAEFKLPQMRLVSVTRHIEPIADHAALVQTIRAFSPSQGWLCYQSAVRCFATNDQVDLSDTSDGYLLNAETCNSDGESLHIRQVGATWIAERFTEVSTSEVSNISGATINVDEEYLADQVTQLCIDQSLGSLNYQRLWQAQPVMGISPIAARFIGFTQATIDNQR